MATGNSEIVEMVRIHSIALGRSGYKRRDLGKLSTRLHLASATGNAEVVEMVESKLWIDNT